MVIMDCIWIGSLLGVVATVLFICLSMVRCGVATVEGFSGDVFVDVVASVCSMSLPTEVVDKKECRRSSICSMLVWSDCVDKDSLSLI